MGEEAIPIILVKGPSGSLQRSLPAASYESRPKSAKKAYTFSPSVTGVTAAGSLRTLPNSLRGRVSTRSHSSLPVFRSKHCVYNLSFSHAVRKTWRDVRTGDDLPERTGALQRRFLAGPNSVGKPV